jgi:hypothetical protein
MDEKLVLIQAGSPITYNFSDGFSFTADEKGVLIPESRAKKVMDSMPGRFVLGEASVLDVPAPVTPAAPAPAPESAPKVQPKKAASKSDTPADDESA